MYKVYLHIPDKDCPAFEFENMEIAEQFCIAVTHVKDVQSAMICKPDTGRNMLILKTYARGNFIG